MSKTKKADVEDVGIVLPTQKVKALSQSPKNLIIISKPKTGKTELTAGLPNCLILDIEEGSDFVDALKIKADSIKKIKEIGEAIKKQDYPYDYIAVDTVTKLEEICIPYAEIIYAKTPMGKHWFKKDPTTGKLDKASGKAQYGNILALPNGAGYSYLRQAYTNIVEYIKTLAPRVILLGHIKDTLLEKNGSEFTASDLDLTGKLKRIATSQSDAIGYLYRDKSGTKNILSFKTSDKIACGARPQHLKNKEIEISEMTDDGLVTHWDKVYID
jgi:hypothetical protein